MEAGRELDALVAEKVMGWKHVPYTAYADEKTAIEKGWYYWVDADGNEILGQLGENSFSTDIAAVWQVIEKCQQRFAVFVSSEGEKWNCNLVHGMRGMAEHIDIDVDADTAPHAICLAALKAVGVNID